MMIRSKRNNKKQNISIRHWLLWGIFLLALSILNYWYLNKYLSFNLAYVTDFVAPEDSLAEYRNPAVASIFYSSFHPKTQINQESGNFNYSKEYNPKIAVISFKNKIISPDALGKVYMLLQKTNPEISNIIILSQDPNEKEEIIYSVSRNDFLKEGINLKINSQIVDELISNYPFYKIKTVSKKITEAYEQISSVYKAFPRAKIIPLFYGKISADQIAESLKDKISRSDTLLMVITDLSREKTDIVTPQKEKDISNAPTGINVALNLSKEFNFHVQVLNLISDEKKVQTLTNDNWEKYPDSEENHPLNKIEQEIKNLEAFIHFYGNDLWLIAKTAIEKASTGRREFSPSRRSFPEDIFNRGASYVYILKEGKPIGEAGNIVPNMSLAQSIADNTYFAMKKIPSLESEEEINKISLKIYLLSNVEPVKYKNEYDLIKKIKQGKDGLVIQDGNRQGVFLPRMWQETNSKKEFMKKLKISAGLNPNYWNSRIKVYRFRTVEVTYEN